MNNICLTLETFSGSVLVEATNVPCVCVNAQRVVTRCWDYGSRSAASGAAVMYCMCRGGEEESISSLLLACRDRSVVSSVWAGPEHTTGAAAPAERLSAAQAEPRMDREIRKHTQTLILSAGICSFFNVVFSFKPPWAENDLIAVGVYLRDRRPGFSVATH